MIADKIRSIFSFGNDSTVGPLQLPGIKTIIMTTNQSLYFREDFVTFDFENQLLKIKKYTPVAASAVLNTRDIDMPAANTLTTTEPTIIKTNRLFEEFPFRKPQAGDKLGIYNKTTKETQFIDITYGGARTIQLAEDFPEDIHDENLVVFYVDGANFDAASPDLLIPYLYLLYKPVSKHNYDTILDINYILGFETTCSRIGNN